MQSLLALKYILIAAVIYTVLISIALLFPTSGIPSHDIPHIDKVVHFIINGILVLIWLFYAFLRKRDQLTITNIVLIIGGCFVYGILIEVCQEIFTTTRQADFMDIIANSTGLLAGYLAFSFVKRKIY